MEYLDSKYGKYHIEKTSTCPKNHRADGYGSRIPTPFVLKLQFQEKTYYRVFAVCWSNVASFYVRIGGNRYFLHDYELEEARHDKNANQRPA